MRIPSDLVAEQIRKHRERLNLTREDLAQECAKLGAPELTAAAIINIEVGRKNPKTGRRRREVSVDELLVLAYAMAVPPLELVFPLVGTAEVMSPPNWQGGITPFLAWRWATGEEPPAHVQPDGKPYVDRSRIGEDGPTRFEAWRQVAHPIELNRRLLDETQAFMKAKGRLAYYAEMKMLEEEEAKHQVRVRQHHLEQMAGVLEEMMRAGVRTPAYDLETAEELRSTGLLSHPEVLPVIQPKEDQSE